MSGPIRADREFTGDQLPSGVRLVQDEPFIIARAADEDSFLAALSPITGFGAKRHHRSYLYRGQSATWPLIPSSRRQAVSRLLSLSHWPINTLLYRQVAEAETLMAFCDLADYQGLKIPDLYGVREVLRSCWGKLCREDVDTSMRWPPQEVLPAFALAQHSGLATCLLDFTRNPFVASYFAARDAITVKESDGEGSAQVSTEKQLCVWVIADPIYTSSFQIPSRVRLVIPPASDNLSLQRQEGLFLYVPRDSDTLQERKAEYVPDEPLEEVISRQSPGSVVQLTMDAACAKALLHKVIKLGYDSSRFFPTFEGVIRCLEDYRLVGVPPTFLWAGGVNV